LFLLSTLGLWLSSAAAALKNLVKSKLGMNHGSSGK
jgi:hypothetical protein